MTTIVVFSNMLRHVTFSEDATAGLEVSTPPPPRSSTDTHGICTKPTIKTGV